MSTSADVSRHGALVFCAIQFPPGSELTLTRSQLTSRFRVVREGGADKGLYLLGIESLEEQPAFWEEYEH